MHLSCALPMLKVLLCAFDMAIVMVEGFKILVHYGEEAGGGGGEVRGGGMVRRGQALAPPFMMTFILGSCLDAFSLLFSSCFERHRSHSRGDT